MDPIGEEKYPEAGVYEHYKSTPEDRRYYQLLGFARHTETNEILTIYVPLYLDFTEKQISQQARPLDMFIEEVDVDGRSVPRFRYIGPDATTL